MLIKLFCQVFFYFGYFAQYSKLNLNLKYCANPPLLQTYKIVKLMNLQYICYVKSTCMIEYINYFLLAIWLDNISHKSSSFTSLISSPLRLRILTVPFAISFSPRISIYGTFSSCACLIL